MTPRGFKITFTKPVEPKTGNDPDSYVMKSYTHHYHRGYGGPPAYRGPLKVTKATLAKDGLSAVIELNALRGCELRHLFWRRHTHHFMRHMRAMMGVCAG